MVHRDGDGTEGQQRLRLEKLFRGLLSGDLGLASEGRWIDWSTPAALAASPAEPPLLSYNVVIDVLTHYAAIPLELEQAAHDWAITLRDCIRIDVSECGPVLAALGRLSEIGDVIDGIVTPEEARRLARRIREACG